MSKRTKSKPKPNYATVHFPPRFQLLFTTAYAEYIMGERAQYSPITGGVIIERGLVREQIPLPHITELPEGAMYANSQNYHMKGIRYGS